MPHTVSVVLPTYNRAATLERAIDSVLKQSYRRFELIIIDDRSTDGTHLILAKYRGLENVRIVSQLERGCSRARNIGVEIAEGRYIAFQDSDDEWMPDFLIKAVSALESTGPETGMFYSDMTRVQQDGTATYWRSPRVRRGRLVDERTLDYQVVRIGMQSAVIKRACFDEVGYFDEALPRFIDLDLFIRLAERFRFVHCRQALVRYHAVQGISTNTAALVVARRRLLRKHHKRLSQHKDHLAQQFVYIAVALEQDRRILLSLVFLLRAIVLSPGWRIRYQVIEALQRRAQEARRLWRTMRRARPQKEGATA